MVIGRHLVTPVSRECTEDDDLRGEGDGAEAATRERSLSDVVRAIAFHFDCVEWTMEVEVAGTQLSSPWDISEGEGQEGCKYLGPSQKVIGLSLQALPICVNSIIV